MAKQLLPLIICGLLISACSKEKSNLANTDSNTNTPIRNTINISIGGEPPTLDPDLSGDSISARVAHDFFEGLVSFNQKGDPIPGLAESWEISSDQKTYTFHLRKGIKFSDGTPITATDFVKSWQRFGDPKTGSPQNNMLEIVVNGAQIAKGQLPPSSLGISAPNQDTVVVKLTRPSESFLYLIGGSPGFQVVPTKVIAAKGTAWTEPQNIVTSGAYKMTEHVVNGYITAEKNPFYYAESTVKIPQVKYLAIADPNAEFNQYQANNVDITNSIPTDRYKEIKAAYPKELYTVQQDAIYFYDFNMMRPELKNNLKLRQALTMAVDRKILTQDILGQGQTELYSYVAPTVSNGKYANVKYEWANWTREKQISEAKNLYAEAGYGADHPLTLEISYNTLDSHKKIAVAIASMWKETLGVNVIAANMEWKTFILARQKGNYQVARDGWVAGKNITDYTDFMFLCDAPQNNTHYCNPAYDELIRDANYTLDPVQKQKIYSQAIMLSMDDYPIIPLYQYTYSRLIKPYVKGYDPRDNHGDDVMTKWMYF
ncbi:MAG TPA: peptide ABC transporter substrate-binding protein [Burkholderiales bacterium]|nr:peptide ABC transporter substrate-binding protein [Burkholderiales bacterium]